MTLVNLYSDTQTQPSRRCAQAMASAEVGDEQRFEDPTVTALCERVAELLGKEAAVFLPSGSMCNQIAVRLHIRPAGDEMFLHRPSHPIIAEAGGPAAIAGAMMHAARRRGRDVLRRRRRAARCATRTATSRARAWSRSSRRRTSAAAASGRWRRCAECSTSRASPGCAPTSTAPVS